MNVYGWDVTILFYDVTVYINIIRWVSYHNANNSHAGVVVLLAVTKWRSSSNKVFIVTILSKAGYICVNNNYVSLII